MKNWMNTRWIGAVVGLLTVLAGPAVGQSSSITYQGSLQEGGGAADGSYAMAFTLWDAAAGGSLVGPEVSLAGVQVESGLFSVELDFGADAWDNSGRWLEIEVEGVILTPRHAVTRSPYSVQTRGIFVNEGGDVGIGTTDPETDLHVESENAALRVSATGDQPSSAGRVELQGGRFQSQFAPLGSLDFIDETGALRAFVGGNKSGANAAQLSFGVTPGQLPQLNIASTRIRMSDSLQVVRSSDLDTGVEINGDGTDSFLQALGGRLAIGHETPVAPLDVMGNAWFRDRVGIGTSGPLTPLDVSGNALFRDRVGIGTATPGAALDVLGDSTFRNRLRIGTTTTSLFGQLNIDDSGDGAVFAISAVSSEPTLPTIYADNEANGPVLWALSSGDVEPDRGGTIVIGDSGGLNLAMDNNEIMVRNNGSTSTLYLNNDGGEISMGEHQVHPAFAYGRVSESGAIISGSASVTGAQRVREGEFRVFVAGGAQPGDIMLATINTRVAVIGTRVEGSNYFVYARGNNTGDPIDVGFQFVIYRP